MCVLAAWLSQLLFLLTPKPFEFADYYYYHQGPGAAVLYAKIVEPMLTKWEPAIDEYKDRVMGAAIEKFGEARKVGEKVLRKGLREGIRRVRVGEEAANIDHSNCLLVMLQGSKLMAGAGAAEEDGGETTQEPPAPTAPAADVVDLADSDEVPH